ncbi:hypothetical protein ACLKA6_007945 [Drosophila palustris]
MAAAPDWLTEDYIKQALKSHYKDSDLHIVRFEVNPALGPGENYGGVLTRVRVGFKLSQQPDEELKKNLIVKTAIDDDELTKELMEPYDIFNREMTLYEKVLPKLTELLKETDGFEPLFPTAIFVDRERSAIIFEDLSVANYVMADRVKRLDKEHVHLILRKLAKMHATSAVFNERNAGNLEKFDRGFFNRYTNAYSGYFVGGLLAAARWMSQEPECAPYAQKLFKLAPHYMDIGRECFAPLRDSVNVLAHGDVWTNNVMVKYDANTGHPVDILIIDFQYSFWGSPTIDLHHFFNTSLREPLRRKEQGNLLKYYHSIFTDTLRQLNYKQNPIPSLHEFQLQAEQKRFFAMHSAVVVQPVMISEDSTDACFNALMNDDERGTRFKNRLYNNPIVQQNLKALMPMFEQKGLLERMLFGSLTQNHSVMGEIRNGNHDNSDEFHPAPQWLTVSYVEDILRHCKKDENLNVTDLSVKPATAKGENYASIMTRIKVDYVRSGANVPETEFFIVKTTYENDPFISSIIAGYQASTTEMIMYDKVLPKMTALLDDTDQSEKIFAKTLHVDYEHSAIIFEDLAVSQYVIGDRLTGFDLEYTKLTLRKLAKMHAAAAVLNERQPGLLTKLDHGIFNRHSRGFSPMFESYMDMAAQFAGECPELGKDYEQKLRRLQKLVMEYTERVYDPQPDEFNTLTHGDLWVNNIMLRPQTEHNPLDMLLIDFQFSAWASPAVDLHYFFSTSLEPEVRIKHQDALIQYYHGVLVDTLRALDFAGYIPTLRQLWLQLEKGKFMAVTITLTSQAIMLNDQNDDADFNALMLDDERSRRFKKVTYNNKKLREILKHWLPIFNQCGLLDVQDSD